MQKIKNFFKNIYNRIKNRIHEISIPLYLKTNILFISFVLVNLINSWVLRIGTMGNWFSIKAIISDLAFILTVGSLGYLLKPNKQFRVLMPLTVIMTLACVINSVYYENYANFASFSMLTTASFLGDMDGAVVTSLIHFKDVILILPVIILPIVHVYLKKHDYYNRISKIERNKKRLLNTIIVAVLMIFITVSSMKPSDYSRLKKQWNREYLVQRFGIYVYQVNDAIKSTSARFSSLFGYDSALKTTKEFYDEKSITDIHSDNKYTNIFEGKNVIFIHAESIMTQDMNLSFNGETLTPNLNKIASEGLYFPNFYSQVSVGTSSDTEFTLNTGLLPAATGTVFVNYWDRTYESMPWLLKDKGYYTGSMHANNASFWNRDVMHKKLGYDKFYARDSFDYSDDSKVIGMGLGDEEFFHQSIEKIKKIDKENDNYYLTMIMLTNHTPWDGGDKYGDYKVSYTNPETGEEMPYMEGRQLGNYFKAVHYADYALGKFIEELDQNGLLDNTVIAIYGDHDAKIAKKEYKYFYNYDFETGELYDNEDPRYVDVDYYNYELNRKVPFILWTKDSKGNKLLNNTVDKVMGMYDILPTMANMMNFKYKYSLGHDIFDNKDNIVVFPNGNWVTDSMYYNAQKDEYLLLKDSVVNDDYVQHNKEYANKLLEVSDSVVVYDLEKELNNEKE